MFGLLAYGFMLAGYWRLHTMPELPERWAVAALLAGLLLGVQALRWVRHLHRYAYKHRDMYLPPAQC